MTGTFVNMAAVAVGALVGVLVGRRMSERLQEIVFQALGLVVGVIGISMSLSSHNMIIAVVSIVLGAATGHLLGIERRLNLMAEKVGRKVRIGGERFTEGLVGATLLYCVGSMAILGSFEDGLGQYPTLLYTKSVYQGSLTLCAEWLSPMMSEVMIDEMTAVGGLMLIGISLSLLRIKEVRTADMLPALIYAPLLAWLIM